MIAINHFWRDDTNLDINFSFSNFSCRFQKGTTDTVVTFNLGTQEEAQVLIEQMEKTIKELKDYVGEYE